MNHKMNAPLKITITILFLAGALNFGQGQTYFGITAGYGLPNITPSASYESYLDGKISREMDNAYFSKGILVEQQLSDHFSLALVSLCPLVHETDITASDMFSLNSRFSEWRNIISLKYKISNFHLGLGGSIGYLYNNEILYYSNSLYSHFDRPVASPAGHPLFRNNLQYSAVLSAAYRYDRFMLELSYQKGLGFRSKDDYFLEPIDALSLSLYCLFKAPWGKRAAAPWF